MAEFTEVMRQRARMCKSYERSCDNCLLARSKNGCYMDCNEFTVFYYDEAKTIIVEWAKSHPEKTLADVFFERNPEAAKTPWNTPLPCPHHVGLTVKRWCESISESSAHDCEKCWNRGFDNKKGKEDM